MSSSTPLEQYFKLVDSGTLKPDDHQTRIVQKLQRLHDEVLTYDPPAISSSSTSSSSSLVCLSLKKIVFAIPSSISPSSLHDYSQGVQLHTPFHYRIMHLKVFTSTVTSVLARPCLWIYFTIPFPHTLNGNEEYISTHS